MNCPACGHDRSSVENTVKWPSVDKRKQVCLKCGYVYTSVAMPVEYEALLECAALVTREWYEARASYNKDVDKLSIGGSLANSNKVVNQNIERILIELAELRGVVEKMGIDR